MMAGARITVEFDDAQARAAPGRPAKARADCTVIFRDSAFRDDVAKTNAVEALRSRGIRDVRFV